MKNTMELVKKMDNMSKFGQESIITDGNLKVYFFIPYTRKVWEFVVDGVRLERRYNAKMAAAYYAELKASE